LTHAGVFAADQLFATLDTTSRKLWIEGAGNIVISDTVGFIRDLPHALVDAFHATLEAAVDADILLHVVDSASHARDEQVYQVNQVLEEIGARDVKQVVVWNKIDLTEAGPGVDRDEYGNIARVRVSARSGEGLELLRESLAEYARAKAESRQEALAAAEREALSIL
jgi:GTP-binding protein HflX